LTTIPTIDNLTKSGLKVFIQADWMEQTGKAEWIMLYGELFGKEKLAKSQFDAIVKNYNDALALVASKKTYSNCFIWPYQDQWYVAIIAGWHFLKDAKANYLWSNVAGTRYRTFIRTGVRKAKTANYWLQQDLINSCRTRN
jgi:iron complex transport system substrate-binding protein